MGKIPLLEQALCKLVGHFLNQGLIEWSQTILGGLTGFIIKQIEQAMSSKPPSSLYPWPLH